MNLLHGIDGIRQLAPGGVLSIGNFDGVHRGHQALLSLARQLAAEQPGRRVAVATFEPHPLTVLRPAKAPPRLASPLRKRQLLAEQGVHDLVELPPDPSVLNLSAIDFWKILRDEVQPSHLIEGSEFSFGKGRGGNIARLREWSQGTAITLHVLDEVEAPLLDCRVTPVSSTVIRWLVAYGRMRDAAICLGRPYALVGEVVQGYQRGRELGVPTANLRCHDQLIPPDGVYAGRCTVAGTTYGAAVSIGTLPTFGQYDRQIEAHLIGYSGDLYGQTLAVELVDWLREQRKYDDLPALKRQIEKDLAETIYRMQIDPARTFSIV